MTLIAAAIFKDNRDEWQWAMPLGSYLIIRSRMTKEEKTARNGFMEY